MSFAAPKAAFDFYEKNKILLQHAFTPLREIGDAAASKIVAVLWVVVWAYRELGHCDIFIQPLPSSPYRYGVQQEIRAVKG